MGRASAQALECVEEVLVLLRFTNLVGAIDVAQHTIPIDDEYGAAAAIAAVVHNVVGAGDSQVLVAQMRKIQTTE